MSDLISREALLEKLKKSRMYHAETSRDMSMLVRCENIVIAQPTVEAEPQWIPCSERLPEEGEEVLIATKTSDKIYFGMYTKRYGFSMREGFMWLNTAIAWMSLPSAFVGE